MENNEKIINTQKKLNEELADLLEKNKIKNFRLISFGNSISSGYSLLRNIKPLLLRNESLGSFLANSNINLDIRNFARAKSNGDDRLFEWLINNTKETEINKMNISDYSGPRQMAADGINREELSLYYHTQKDDDIGLRDAVVDSSKDLTNIVIYNGCTGSLVDSFTRNGKLKNKLFYSIKKDSVSLEAILKFIEFNNRKNGANTEVYICGAPNFLGLNISEIINTRLKRIAGKYSNTVYVEPVKSKAFYKPINKDENTTSKGSFPKFDIHYNEEEYLKLNNNIIKSIIDNYSFVKAMIQVDRALYNYNNTLENEAKESFTNLEDIRKYVLSVFANTDRELLDDNSKEKFYTKSKKYLKDRYPYDFYYVGKDNIKDAHKLVKKKK